MIVLKVLINTIIIYQYPANNLSTLLGASVPNHIDSSLFRRSWVQHRPKYNRTIRRFFKIVIKETN